jgi:hypothetical protein
LVLAVGSRRSQGWFYLDGGQIGEQSQRVVLVDSPIEALSKWVLEQPRVKRSLDLAVDREIPMDLLKRSAAVVLACGVDAIGEALTQQVQSQVPGMLREYPQGKGWNQDLQAMHQGDRPLKQPQRPVRRDGIER